MWSLLNIPITVLVVSGTKANAASSNSRYNKNSALIHRLQQHVSPDPGQVLENLALYDKLWIEVKSKSNNNEDEGRGNSCVWSECGIDETDDAYVGDYRDGDEQWYQYRTQSFCANAAYSLYGSLKEDSGMFSGGWKECSKRHFINSFFTYGGADNLLLALGEVPIAYYEDANDDAVNDDAANDDANGDDAYVDDANGGAANGDDANGDDANGDDANGDDANANGDDANNGDDGNNGDDDANNDDDGYGTTNNANCVEIDDEVEEQDEEQEEEQEYAYGDNYDNEGNNRRHNNRQLSSDGSGGSNDNDNDSYSSSLGCTSTGNYIMAAFQSSSCDGNYFIAALDTFDAYNAQHANIGCNSIWESNDGNNDEGGAMYNAIYALLKQSWTCDIRLYPNSCPDPHGEKGRYEYALRTALHGGNPMWAYKNVILRRPLRRLAWSLLVLTVAIFVVTYVVKNRKRIDNGNSNGEKGRGGMLKGCCRCVGEDVVSGWLWAKAGAATVSRMGVVRAAMIKTKKSKRRRRSDGRDKNHGTSKEGVHNGVMV